ncbi:hypothetical protein LOTGIDRAFT_229984 [Lottia gigantea]|uniref:EF-hand domain-containing protein n=1 Tax=Lottia gigantea TaxID=225164 RepID=V4BBI3_LOTGI|nr:hypothetical protein LOTGIDRAFT_229984 [Lottia gigantea]ESP04906.1 hypothetical protein LOTGIDRAFT_229984 [Lottia gigantea]
MPMSLEVNVNGSKVRGSTSSYSEYETASVGTDFHIFGPFTGHLSQIFEKYEEDGRVCEKKLIDAFHDLNLFPSKSQIHEMVHCAVEYGSPCCDDNITFGEFCVLVDELQHHYNKSLPFTCPQSSLKKKWEHGTDTRRKRKESQSNFQVFLGGSCNPTTWRRDIAIPFLKKEVITFYNPQVNTWRQELIELEDKAKQSADLLCFVIDNQTRAVVSMIETAYLVGCYRQIIVVMNAYEKDEEILINGKQISQSERFDLMRVRNILIDLVERNSIPVFSDVHSALNCVVTCLHQGIRVQDLQLQHGASPVRYGHLEVGESLLKLRETFNSITCKHEGRMSFKDVQLAYKAMTNQQLPSNWLKHKKKSYTFEELCCLISEFKRQRPSTISTFLTKLLSPITWLINKVRGPTPVMESYNDDGTRDIYLGGSCGKSSWREDIAIPMLRRHGLSYLNPFVSEWIFNMIPMQVAAREKCRLLLYILTEESRSFSAMVEAGYYIGRGCRVVLCIQYLKKGSLVSGEHLSDCTIEDYNRGRMYLSDMASKEGVQIFEDLEESINCAISLLKETT